MSKPLHPDYLQFKICRYHGIQSVKLYYKTKVKSTGRIRLQCKACILSAAKRSKYRTGKNLWPLLKKLGFSNKEIKSFFTKHQTLESRQRAFFELKDRYAEKFTEESTEHEYSQGDRYDTGSW